MTDIIYSREKAIRMAAEMASEGDDVRSFASDQSHSEDEILEVARLVWEEQMDVDDAVARVLSRDA